LKSFLSPWKRKCPPNSYENLELFGNEIRLFPGFFDNLKGFINHRISFANYPRYFSLKTQIYGNIRLYMASFLEK